MSQKTTGTAIASQTVTTATGVCTHLLRLEPEPVPLPLPPLVGGGEVFATAFELVPGLDVVGDGVAGGGNSRGWWRVETMVDVVTL